jgi:sigma-B regulation protein RsbU (phosphoserine phosphatase)
MSHKILVVDDSLDNRTIIKACLNAEGFSVVELSSGEELLELGIKILNFDLILLDVMMPNLNGYETCVKLKEKNIANQIPIIFLSAEIDEDSKVKGFESGGIDYIQKPFGRKELCSRVNSHIAYSKKYTSIENQNDILRKNLKSGAEIQNNFLPANCFEFEGLDLVWNYRPAEHIAGDMFGFIKFDDNCLGVYLLDVCGHGSAAALVASAVHGAINSNKDLVGITRRGSYLPLEPAQVISNLNLEFPYSRFERFFTFFYALINLEKNQIICASAGHPAPYIVRVNGECEKVKVEGTILGLNPRDTWEQEIFNFMLDEKLVLLSDGLLELKNSKDEFFEDSLISVLKNLENLDNKSFVKQILRESNKFSDSVTQVDDQTIISIQKK